MASSSRESTTISDNISSTSTSLTKKRKTSRPNFDEIWSYYIQGDSSGNGHYKATCYYCNESWKHGKPQAMKVHLANQCNSCPKDISAHWHKKLAEKINKYIHKSAP
ncbi:6143_t:CDS:1, partial [Cetraspora pellucida]